MSLINTNNENRSSINHGTDTSKLTSVTTLLTNPMAFDTRRLHPLAGLEKSIEYMDLKNEQLSTMKESQGLIPSRGWSDDICYGTGAVYLLGLGIGGLSDLIQGIKAIPPNESGKLQLNTILNNVTKRGPFLGNSTGVLALSYNIVNSSIDALREKHDSASSILAGALTGAIFKSSKGLKPMGYASGLMTGACAVWCGVKNWLLA